MRTSISGMRSFDYENSLTLISINKLSLEDLFFLPLAFQSAADVFLHPNGT